MILKKGRRGACHDGEPHKEHNDIQARAPQRHRSYNSRLEGEPPAIGIILALLMSKMPCLGTRP